MARDKGPGNEKQTRKLNDEQREFVLNCLACRMRLMDVVEYLLAEFGVKVEHTNISYYKREYAEEIDKRRQVYLKDIKSLSLPFVQQAERLAAYGRMATIELNRKRYKDARECMRAIAEETGDLKQTRDVNVRAADRPTSDLLETVQGALDRVDGGGAGSGGGASDPAPTAGRES